MFFYHLSITVLKYEHVHVHTCKVIDYLVNIHWFGRNRWRWDPPVYKQFFLFLTISLSSSARSWTFTCGKYLVWKISICPSTNPTDSSTVKLQLFKYPCFLLKSYRKCWNVPVCYAFNSLNYCLLWITLLYIYWP